jgi:hypothetical protein
MKKIKYIFSMLLLVLIFVGCEDYSAPTPKINSVELLSTRASGSAGAVSASFMLNCEATQVVVWWGDDASDYDKYDSLLANPATDKNVTKDYPVAKCYVTSTDFDGSSPVSHIYKAPGDYTVVVIASTSGDFGKEMKQTIFQQTYTIAVP